MDAQKELLTKQIVSDIRRMTRAVYLDSKNMVKVFGLSNPQRLVLKTIHTNGPSSLADLSRLLSVTPANMTGLIDRLEKKELVLRTPKIGDRRSTLVELTAQGKTLGRSVPDSIEEKLVAGLTDVAPDELKNMMEVFQKVVDLLDVNNVGDAPLDPDPRTWLTLDSVSSG